MKLLCSSFALALGLALAGCGGTSKIGETCSTGGATDDCESGAICTNESGGALICRKICVEQADCDAATQQCNGVTGGSTKSCQPK